MCIRHVFWKLTLSCQSKMSAAVGRKRREKNYIAMWINADFSRKVFIGPDEYSWVASPQGGVERMMLDRLGAEKARATSIVRYVPNSYFPSHTHVGGEEIFVLSGVFSDDSGDYPAGWYLRNPPGSRHQPFSKSGALIFVKLWQMSHLDRDTIRIDTRLEQVWHRTDSREICPLYANDTERVCLQRLIPGARLLDDAVNGAELLVLAGDIEIDGRSFGRGSWMRLPGGLALIAGSSGASVYLKTGHLNNAY